MVFLCIRTLCFYFYSNKLDQDPTLGKQTGPGSDLINITLDVFLIYYSLIKTLATKYFLSSILEGFWIRVYRPDPNQYLTFYPTRIRINPNTRIRFWIDFWTCLSIRISLEWGISYSGLIGRDDRNAKYIPLV